MARIFSIKSLAELICDGHDTASAAKLFQKSVSYVQRVQSSDTYKRQLALCIERQAATRSGTAPEERVYSSIFGETE